MEISPAIQSIGDTQFRQIRLQFYSPLCLSSKSNCTLHNTLSSSSFHRKLSTPCWIWQQKPTTSRAVSGGITSTGVQPENADPAFAVKVFRSSTQSSNSRSSHISSPYVLIKSRLPTKSKKRLSQLFVAENDRLITDPIENSKNLEAVFPLQNASSTPSDLSSLNEPNITGEQEKTAPPKKVKLTARERLRAARVLSRDSDQSKPSKPQMGRSVLDALRESEKGKKGLPEAPANMLDDSKRGMPKKGLTFDFPGGLDLLLIAFSFVFISTVMFATTYIVWKVGAIHFNEN